MERQPSHRAFVSCRSRRQRDPSPEDLTLIAVCSLGQSQERGAQATAAGDCGSFWKGVVKARRGRMARRQSQHGTRTFVNTVNGRLRRFGDGATMALCQTQPGEATTGAARSGANAHNITKRLQPEPLLLLQKVWGGTKNSTWRPAGEGGCCSQHKEAPPPPPPTTARKTI